MEEMNKVENDIRRRLPIGWSTSYASLVKEFVQTQGYTQQWAGFLHQIAEVQADSFHLQRTGASPLCARETRSHPLFRPEADGPSGWRIGHAGRVRDPRIPFPAYECACCTTRLLLSTLLLLLTRRRNEFLLNSFSQLGDCSPYLGGDRLSWRGERLRRRKAPSQRKLLRRWTSRSDSSILPLALLCSFAPAKTHPFAHNQHVYHFQSRRNPLAIFRLFKQSRGPENVR